MNRACIAFAFLAAAPAIASAQNTFYKFQFTPAPVPKSEGFAPQATTLTFYSGQSWLGVGLADLTDASAANLHASSVNGAEVVEVYPDSPAATAGLQPRDVITEYNGESVTSVRQLERLVSETPANRTVAVTLLRDGKPVDAKVHMEARAGQRVLRDLVMPRIEARRVPDAPPAPGVPAPPPMPPMPEMAPLPATPALPGMARGELGTGWTTRLIASGGDTLGLSLENLTPQLGEYFGLKSGQSGLLVRSVAGDSAAAKAG